MYDYVCMYVCMYVCLYVCMYVCLHVCVCMCVYIYINCISNLVHYLFVIVYLCKQGRWGAVALTFVAKAPVRSRWIRAT